MRTVFRSSITFSTMIGNNTNASPVKTTFLKRVCAFVLLSFVALGAIAGAAHNHGDVSLQLRAGNVGLESFNSNDDSSSSRQIPNGGECLVCQLHRNLYSGLLSSVPQISTPVTQFAFAPRIQDRIVSQTYTPRRGRAPPLASLI